MKLQVTEQREELSRILLEAGASIDLRCGGRGSCGRCRVKVLSGIWMENGRAVTAPAEVLACRTRLLSAVGEVELPEPDHGKIELEWISTRALPECAVPVVAVDIGTTTIAAIKIEHGKIVGRAGCFNGQNRFGDNVVTRIAAAAHQLPQLQKAVLESISSLLTELGAGEVARIAVAGNTVMSCLFHGIDPATIGVAPFTPPCRIFPERRDLFGTIPVWTVPAIAGYVGGDLTAGVLETELQPGEMLVDIGTNCEIVYRSESGWVCTAAAAGPAFEGAGIHCGMRAVAGAIDHIRNDGSYSVIGGGAPRGLCGSALIDLLATGRRRGRLNQFGRIEPPASQWSLAPGVFLTEPELEQLLKAKAAVGAGIATLEAYCGVPAKVIYLAGGFARYLDLEHAVAIGMLPACREFRVVGNTSLGGAAQLALAPDLVMPELLWLIDLPRELPLNLLPGFETRYLDGLLLH